MLLIYTSTRDAVVNSDKVKLFYIDKCYTEGRNNAYAVYADEIELSNHATHESAIEELKEIIKQLTYSTCRDYAVYVSRNSEDAGRK